MSTPTQAINFHNGQFVGSNLKGDPLQNAKYVVGVAKKLNDPSLLSAGNEVLAQLSQLLTQTQSSLPGDQDLIVGYQKLRADYLRLKDANRALGQSNEAFRLAVVEMGRVMTAQGMSTPDIYMQAISGGSEFPIEPSMDSDWPDPSKTGDSAS